MKITVLCVGKTKERFLQEGIAKYLKYLKHYADVEVREIKEEKIRDLREAPTVRKKEAERILKALPPGVFVAALDERGQSFTSHEFADFVNSFQESGVRQAVFVLGGAMGLEETVTERADKVVAMSRWTFTHEMARLALLEQLYRAFTIITGKTYHY